MNKIYILILLFNLFITLEVNAKNNRVLKCESKDGNITVEWGSDSNINIICIDRHCRNNRKGGGYINKSLTEKEYIKNVNSGYIKDVIIKKSGFLLKTIQRYVKCHDLPNCSNREIAATSTIYELKLDKDQKFGTLYHYKLDSFKTGKHNQKNLDL